MNPIDRLLFAISLHNLVKRRITANENKPSLEIKNNICFDDALRLDILKNSKEFPPNHFEQSHLSSDDFHHLQQSLARMFKTQKIHTTFEIQEITGLNASSSDIKNRTSMDDFIAQDCREYFEINEESFQENLNHKQIAIIHDQNTTDHFALFGWNPILYLNNGSGGSHHFASMRYIAEKLNRPYYLSGTFELTYIDSAAVQDFNNQYSGYLLNQNDLYEINKLIEIYKIPSYIFSNSNKLPNNTSILFFKNSHWKLFGFQRNAINNAFTSFNAELNKHLAFQQQNKTFIKHLVKGRNNA